MTIGPDKMMKEVKWKTIMVCIFMNMYIWRHNEYTLFCIFKFTLSLTPVYIATSVCIRNREGIKPPIFAKNAYLAPQI